MTINDYYMVMSRSIDDSVGIAELKARLSHHLRKVRNGDSLVVLDRATPVARIVPHDEPATPLRVRKPKSSAPAPGKVQLPPSAPLDGDIVDLLLEDRSSGR